MHHCHWRDFLSLRGDDSALLSKMVGVFLKADTVHTASFGGDVKPSVPGYWLVLAYSCYFRLPS